MRDTLDTPPPPPLPPGEGREYYLPEVYYLFDTQQVSPGVALRVTARCLAQWCDRYEVEEQTHVGADGTPRLLPGRTEKLPPSPEDRRAALEHLFAWIEQSRAGQESMPFPLTLYTNGESLLVDQGVTFLLVLTPAQFAQLQECWERHGLPRDLYYPASAQQAVVEPVTMAGGVIQMRQRYSPKRWSLRAALLQSNPPAATEDDRRRHILDASRQFLGALILREWELHEPESTPDPDEAQRVRESMLAVDELIHYTAQLLRDTGEGAV